MSTRANIVIDQGTTFSTNIILNDAAGTPVNLSTYVVKSQFRKAHSSVSAYTFQTTANSSGSITMSINATASANVTAGRYVYDLIVTDTAGNTTRVLEGQVTINPSVSKN
jgi:hypothetical protein